LDALDAAACPSSVPPQRSNSVDSSVRSPMSPAQRHGSVDSLKPVDYLSKTSGFTLKQQDFYTSFSQPASPAKGTGPGLTKAQSMNDNLHQGYRHQQQVHNRRQM